MLSVGRRREGGRGNERVRGEGGRGGEEKEAEREGKRGRREGEREGEKERKKRRGGRRVSPDPGSAVSNLGRLAPKLTANSVCK